MTIRFNFDAFGAILRLTRQCLRGFRNLLPWKLATMEPAHNLGGGSLLCCSGMGLSSKQPFGRNPLVFVLGCLLFVGLIACQKVDERLLSRSVKDEATFTFTVVPSGFTSVATQPAFASASASASASGSASGACATQPASCATQPASCDHSASDACHGAASGTLASSACGPETAPGASGSTQPSTCASASPSSSASSSSSSSSSSSASSTHGEPATRSFYAPINEDAVHNLNIWLYQDGVLFPEYCSYIPNLSTNTTTITFPNINAKYNLYFLANVGEKTPPQYESQLQTYTLNFASYSSFRTAGLPMCGAMLNYKPEQGTNVPLEKLVGRYMIFTHVKPTLKNVRYTFTSVRLRNCAKMIRPWGSEPGISGYASRVKNASEMISAGDYLSTEDIAALNNGDDVYIYYLENCQGCLLPDNTQPRLKNQAAITSATGDPMRASLCSYLEITCRAETPTITYENATYRVYMGLDNTSDFSVKRATSNNLMINVISDSITEEPWFVEPGAGTITGQLLVTETNPFANAHPYDLYDVFTSADNTPPTQVISNPSFYLQNNLMKVYYIYANDTRIVSNLTQSIPESASPYVHCTFEPLTFTYTVKSTNTGSPEEGGNNHDNFRTYTCKHWKKLTVTTDCSPNSFASVFGSMSIVNALEQVVNLQINSSDGVLSVPIRVGVIGTLAVSFSLSSSNLLQMKIFDPMGYTLSKSYIGIEAFTAGSHYWYDNTFLHWDSPFWALFLKKSSFGARTYDSAAKKATFTETAYPANLSNEYNTLFNTLSLADDYKRTNKRANKPEYAYADLIYGRINTMELTFAAPAGYVFRNIQAKNIPLKFSSTQNIMNGKFASNAIKPHWEGIFVLNGKLLEYNSSSELPGFNFELNSMNQSYYLDFDTIYNRSTLRGSSYRDPNMQRYNNILSYGSGGSEGLHTDLWWNSFYMAYEDYYPQ